MLCFASLRFASLPNLRGGRGIKTPVLNYDHATDDPANNDAGDYRPDIGH